MERGALFGNFIFSCVITLASYKKLTKEKVFFKSLSHLQFLIGIYKNVFKIKTVSLWEFKAQSIICTNLSF